jgi:Xaa-Pro aminopeptidase
METVPQTELISRVATFQAMLGESGVALALLRQPADLFYYTGTIVEGFLAVSAAGPVRLLVRRPKDRLAVGQTPWPVLFYRSLPELPGLLADLDRQGAALGLELDVMPAALYLHLQAKLFPRARITDVAPLIRRQRMRKSPFELTQIRAAAAMLDQVHAEVPELLVPGRSELELSALLEYRLRSLGHQGLVRFRRWDLEVFYGHVLSGTSSLAAAYTDTPSGGLGFSPAFPQGPSHKALAANEPISVDLAACVGGYIADMTRLYAIGGLPMEAWRVFAVVEELYHLFATETRAGVLPGDLYQKLWDVVQKRGLADCFMGAGNDRVTFLAHGVGLELDELPLLTARSPYALEADMVLAFEPKFFLPGIGMVGQEDTCRITAAGVEWLTLSPRQVTVVS